MKKRDTTYSDRPHSVKQVGRRKPPENPFQSANGFLESVIELHGDKPFVPKGVYRFHTHNEADAWMMNMLTR